MAKLNITSTGKSVTFSRTRDEVYAKNRINFDQVKTTIYFKMDKNELFNNEVNDIVVNGVQLTRENAKGLLSDALFREVSTGGIEGETNNWSQTDF